jgi:hypothetical protein
MVIGIFTLAIETGGARSSTKTDHQLDFGVDISTKWRSLSF